MTPRGYFRIHHLRILLYRVRCSFCLERIAVDRWLWSWVLHWFETQWTVCSFEDFGTPSSPSKLSSQQKGKLSRTWFQQSLPTSLGIAPLHQLLVALIERYSQVLLVLLLILDLNKCDRLIKIGWSFAHELELDWFGCVKPRWMPAKNFGVFNILEARLPHFYRRPRFVITWLFLVVTLLAHSLHDDLGVRWVMCDISSHLVVGRVKLRSDGSTWLEFNWKQIMSSNKFHHNPGTFCHQSSSPMSSLTHSSRFFRVLGFHNSRWVGSKASMVESVFARDV